MRRLDLALEAFRWAILAKAVEIASSCEAAVYDSYFLALALDSDSILVIADEAFVGRARRYASVIPLSRLRVPD
jgi:predicted nucleic acid-binding protein